MTLQKFSPKIHPFIRWPALVAGACVLAVAPVAEAAPQVTRLTPPSALFSFNDPNPPYIARFLPGQRFDLQATIVPDAGNTLTHIGFYVDGKLVNDPVSLTPATATGVPTNAVVCTLRAYSNKKDGVHTLEVRVRQSDNARASARGNFEVADLKKEDGKRAKNVIVLIGDGLGIAHRTAARIMLHGVGMGKANAPLSMDTFPNTALVMTHSLNSIVTDSSPGSACYSTGNKANNNQHGVFPDDTTALFDNPRVETIGEYLWRTEGKVQGLVTTSDIFDATPAAWASHTQSRAAGTGIIDQYLDEMTPRGLRVLLGGGRKWFLPSTVPGTARAAGSDYVLPAELASGWGVSAGAIDPERDVIADFTAAHFTYVADNTQLNAVSSRTKKLLGLFSLSNMNVAKDKIDKRRNPGVPGLVDDFGFPDQPMLDDMTRKALEVLDNNDEGFVLMVEGASIDKQAHNMDTERWILDTIEFDRAVEVCKKFAQRNRDTLVVITADHECGGINIIGGSRVTNADLQTRAASGLGAAQLRNGVVGTYEAAGFPHYPIAADGYPTTTDVDFRMLIGYAANADRFEDWLTNPFPLRDSQQPFNNVPPLNLYPSGPLNRDVAGNFLVTGQIADSSAAHTASDIPLSAFGRGASLFNGVMDNTDVFFKIMEAVFGEQDEDGDRDRDHDKD